jgi:hypothetical protein
MGFAGWGIYHRNSLGLRRPAKIKTLPFLQHNFPLGSLRGIQRLKPALPFCFLTDEGREGISGDTCYFDLFEFGSSAGGNPDRLP